MKRLWILALFIVVALAAPLMLAACGGEETTTTAAPATTAPPTTAAPTDTTAAAGGDEVGIFFEDLGNNVVKITDVPAPGMSFPVTTSGDMASTIEAFDASGASLGKLTTDTGELDYSSVAGKAAKIVVTGPTGTVSEWTVPAGGAPATTAGQATETLKIGAVVWTGWPLGYDMKRGVEIMAMLDNEAGGIDIGGTKYNVEFIFIESNNDQATTMSAVNKLIYEDKVQFMINDTQYPGAVFAETEKNKVISLSGCPIPIMFDPSFKYTFAAGAMHQATPEVAGWIANNVPEITTVDLAYPDEGGGRAYAEGAMAVLAKYGIEVTPIIYPVTSTDFSSVGTQVKADNPSAFIALGNSAMDALIYQAVVQAGYSGLLFATTTTTYETLKTAVPEEALEGFIGGAWPVEFDPAATPVAQEFKDKWIEVNGKWDGPEIQLTMAYAALREALIQAGTLDVEAVAEVLANGLTFEGPTGKSEMIPRNDLGISRTVDNISEFCVKKIVDGVPTLLHTITLEEAKTYIDPAAFGQ